MDKKCSKCNGRGVIIEWINGFPYFVHCDQCGKTETNYPLFIIILGIIIAAISYYIKR